MIINISCDNHHARFEDVDTDGQMLCKFQVQVYWAKQFEAVRKCFFGEDQEANFIRSLSGAARWQATGGKSGASFSKTSDDRLVTKVCICDKFCSQNKNQY